MSGKEIEAGVALPHTMPQPLCRSAGDCVSVKVRIADPVHVDGLSGLLQDPLHPHDETSVPNGMGEENVEAICQGAQRGVESEPLAFWAASRRAPVDDDGGRAKPA